jgi:chromosome segregation ATPase
MNAHTSVDQLLAEVRGLETHSGMLDGTIRDMEIQLAALRASKAKVDDELDMYRAAADRVRAGQPAFTEEQRQVVRKTRKQRAPSVLAGELPADRADRPVAQRFRRPIGI